MIVLSCLSDMKNKKRKVARYFRNTSLSQAYRLFIKTYALKVYRKSLVVVVSWIGCVSPHTRIADNSSFILRLQIKKSIRNLTFCLKKRELITEILNLVQSRNQKYVSWKGRKGLKKKAKKCEIDMKECETLATVQYSTEDIEEIHFSCYLLKSCLNNKKLKTRTRGIFSRTDITG